MARKERGRPESGVIRMGTSAKDTEVISSIDYQPPVKLEGPIEEGVVKTGTSAKWVRARRIK